MQYLFLLPLCLCGLYFAWNALACAMGRIVVTIVYCGDAITFGLLHSLSPGNREFLGWALTGAVIGLGVGAFIQLRALKRPEKAITTVLAAPGVLAMLALVGPSFEQVRGTPIAVLAPPTPPVTSPQSVPTPPTLQRNVFVEATSVYLRKTPSPTAKAGILQRIATPCVVIEDAGAEWAKVRCAGSEGFVRNEYLSATAPTLADLLSKVRASAGDPENVFKYAFRAIALAPDNAGARQAAVEGFFQVEHHHLVQSRTTPAGMRQNATAPCPERASAESCLAVALQGLKPGALWYRTAISGLDFTTVSPEGKELFTRSGFFHRTAQGIEVTVEKTEHYQAPEVLLLALGEGQSAPRPAAHPQEAAEVASEARPSGRVLTLEEMKKKARDPAVQIAAFDDTGSGPAPAPMPEAPPARQPVNAKGSVRVVTLDGDEPTWAGVMVDDKRIANTVTPATFDLPAGKHKVAVERNGFKTSEREVDVKAGETAVVRFALTR